MHRVFIWPSSWSLSLFLYGLKTTFTKSPFLTSPYLFSFYSCFYKTRCPFSGTSYVMRVFYQGKNPVSHSTTFGIWQLVPISSEGPLPRHHIQKIPSLRIVSSRKDTSIHCRGSVMVSFLYVSFRSIPLV